MHRLKQNPSEGYVVRGSTSQAVVYANSRPQNAHWFHRFYSLARLALTHQQTVFWQQLIGQAGYEPAIMSYAMSCVRTLDGDGPDTTRRRVMASGSRTCIHGS